jgi:small subunit ribosomal protein S6
MIDPSLTSVSLESLSDRSPMTQTPYYETMYILRPDIPEEEVESHLTKYRDILVEAGAEVLDNQMRGKRRLAYAINKNKEGIYVQLSHNGDGQQVAVLEKAMRLSEDVMRYLTVKQEGPLPEPRVMPGSAPAAAAQDQAEPAGTPA